MACNCDGTGCGVLSCAIHVLPRDSAQSTALAPGAVNHLRSPRLELRNFAIRRWMPSVEIDTWPWGCTCPNQYFLCIPASVTSARGFRFRLNPKPVRYLRVRKAKPCNRVLRTTTEEYLEKQEIATVALRTECRGEIMRSESTSCFYRSPDYAPNCPCELSISIFLVSNVS